MPIKTKKRQYKSTKKNKSIKSNFEKTQNHFSNKKVGSKSSSNTVI